MKNNSSFHSLLVFPPVWTPVTPYLALPLLVSYLRSQGLSVSQFDASLDFFGQYLLKSETLFGLLNRIFERTQNGHYADLPEPSEEVLQDLRRNRRSWEEKIKAVKITLNTLRCEESFFQPDSCMRAQKDLYDLLRLASLAYYPVTFTFNTFSNKTIKDFPGMIRFCDDEAANPFLPFYKEELLKRISPKNSNLLGISVPTSHQLVGALTLGRLIKKRYPSVHVTLGGKHILRLQESFLRYSNFFSEFCDSLIVDNGERPLKELIKNLEGKGSWRETPNLVYFHEGRLVFNEHGPHEPIFNLPAPDFTDLPLKNYFTPTPIIPIRLSEGCYWGKCTFCSRYDNKKFQTLPPETAVKHMEEIQRRHNVSCFTVNDDCLTPTYLEVLSREIIKKGLGFQISLWCKPVATFSEEKIKLLSKAGVRLIRWGTETGNPRILKLMNKGTRLDSTVRVLRDSSEAGIWNHAMIIFGFPTETVEEAKETIRFIEKHQDIIHSSIFFRFVLLEHSYIVENPEEFALQSVTEDSNIFSSNREFTTSEGMEKRALSEFLHWAQQYRKKELYGHPFWYYLRIREYLLLYTARFGVQEIRNWKVDPRDLSLCATPKKRPAI